MLKESLFLVVNRMRVAAPQIRKNVKEMFQLKLGAMPSSEKDPPSNGIKGAGANTSDEENHIKIDAVPV